MRGSSKLAGRNGPIKVSSRQGGLRFVLLVLLLAVVGRAAGEAADLLKEGQAALAAGDYARAFELASRAAGMFAGKDSASEASGWNTAASAQLYRGDYSGALELFRRALAIDRRSHDAKGEVSRLGNIGNAFFFQGKYLDALENYQAALQRVEQNATEPWAAGRRQIALTNLAILYEQLGQNQRALDYYRQALASGGGISPAERGQVLSNLGTLYRRLGDAVKALESYEEAQKLFAQQHLSDAEIHVLQNAGIALALDFGDTVRAGRSFGEALRLAEATGNRREIVLAHLFRGEALYRAGDAAGANRDFEAALAGAKEIGASEEQWTALYGVARAVRAQDPARALERLREAIGVIESVRSTLANPSLKSDFLADKRDVYDAAIALLLDTPARDTGQLFHLFEQARARNLRDALRGVAAPSLTAVQQRLPVDGALVEYWVGEGRLAAIWITRTRTGIVDRAWSTADTAAARTFAAALRDGGRANGPALISGIPLDGIGRVAIVPDGALYLIPFEVLPVGGRMLIERMPVWYLPSAALLVRDQGSRPALAPWRRQIAAFGDPAVDARGALPGDESWSRLPEAARELRAVTRALPGRAGIYAGTENLKRRLTGGASDGVPVLHFATHATVDATDSNRSRMLFTPEPGSQGSEYLFRGEAQNLKLDGVDLVTVSACDTEAGRLARGEGVQSFSRSFLAAGARATVTTLWRVEDRATADFMQLFYTNLGKGATKAESLRAAKLSFVKRGAPPAAWAAFVLNGDGDAPLTPVLPWWRVLAIAGTLAAVVTWFYRFRRR